MIKLIEIQSKLAIAFKLFNTIAFREYEFWIRIIYLLITMIYLTVHLQIVNIPQ